MFSATEPLASSPLATNGTNKLVSSTTALSQGAQALAGNAARRKLIYSTSALAQAAQVLQGNSFRTRVLFGSADLSQGAQIVAGAALYTRVLQGTGSLQQAPQEVLAICYVTKVMQGSAALTQAAQTLLGAATRLKTTNGNADLIAAAQRLNGAATKIRVLYGAGDLIAAPQTLYGSEVSPIWITTLRAPINIYEVSRKITSEPYSTANKYLTLYQVPGYKEVQNDGSIRDIDITGIITAMVATTADGTPQDLSVIVIRLLDRGFDIYPLMPSFEVTKGVQNIMPLRDFNLVTGDIIQIKALGAGDVTVNMSILLNTQTYYEVS